MQYSRIWFHQKELIPEALQINVFASNADLESAYPGRLV